MRLKALLAMIVLTEASAAHAKAGKPQPARVDDNFGCNLSGQRLTEWMALRLSLPRGVAGKFRYWKTVASAEVPPEPFCKKMPAARFMIGESWGGQVQRIDLVVAKEGVTVYRAFSKGKFHCSARSVAGKFGAWWSFEQPTRKKAFRKANALCHEWNDLSMTVSCTLKAGTVIAVGPTQSAKCERPPDAECPRRPEIWPVSYPESNRHQIYFNLFDRPESEISKFLTKCRVTPWAGTE